MLIWANISRNCSACQSDLGQRVSLKAHIHHFCTTLKTNPMIILDAVRTLDRLYGRVPLPYLAEAPKHPRLKCDLQNAERWAFPDRHAVTN